MPQRQDKEADVDLRELRAVGVLRMQDVQVLGLGGGFARCLYVPRKLFARNTPGRAVDVLRAVWCCAPGALTGDRAADFEGLRDDGVVGVNGNGSAASDASLLPCMPSKK